MGTNKSMIEIMEEMTDKMIAFGKLLRLHITAQKAQGVNKDWNDFYEYDADKKEFIRKFK